MRHEFAVLSWEYRGADFDSTPHALASLEIGGQKRDFLLKMREGIIYFKEPHNLKVFAVTHQSGDELSGGELIKAWCVEVGRENFGRCYSRPLYSTVVVAIIRTDFSGWISDAFHLKWHEIPKHRNGKTINIWKHGVGNATWRW